MERAPLFNPAEVGKLFRPEGESKNGQITIIGGSELFHGAPLLSLTVASKIVDMVYFSSPDTSVGEVANNIKSKLFSFIWVPWEDVDKYIEKSDAILMGPGFMRYRREGQNVQDDAWLHTRKVTQGFLEKYKDKKWVIDAGSLQVLEKDWIPTGAILTPNKREYSMLFGDIDPVEASKKFNCTIVLKGVVDKVCSNGECVEVAGGNAGMAKGGTGDTLAGLTVALYAKNEASLAASCASYITKTAGDELYGKVRTNFNADDLAQQVPQVLGRLQEQK
ncbi:MAG: NAD(P)H-hydrate dehydratase [Candidatus Woesebacteria bacterium]|nr:MAG: NAD(P)H-hydrate dehydratase [Candidatus Woesebacteria bacterium]